MTYETKFTKGQEVWMMRENKAVSWKVFGDTLAAWKFSIHMMTAKQT